ncbi:gliding motility lipoprotein GldD [Pseudoflavitalea sp. G-6-1-2]|uniref:gliding motility lipoprotein GldD n=1 Tax=Pseudoflavitalea sp. G-6-1-2 TaxID=2728841 RepID=UPI00146E01B9|nr:gliding motility lipoprotein GldD [Pseudoflavitalea sp. G-6-1-2]NML20343.1 gliding motility lipoprotein GldD [Pseudoflavitalea sp. G-6-1-2]
MKPVALLSLIAFFVISCNSEFTPKRKGYFRIDFPKHEYRVFDQPGYPYTFEYPVYASVVKDSTYFEAQPENPYWVNIDFPRFNGRIYISYKQISKNNFTQLVNDAYTMTYKHTSKATEITDSVMRTNNNVSGIFFEVGGNAATAKQFFLSDSTKNFLRGALYFDATPNEDSLSVVNNFLQEDMKHLINSLKWK